MLQRQCSASSRTAGPQAQLLVLTHTTWTTTCTTAHIPRSFDQLHPLTLGHSCSTGSKELQNSTYIKRERIRAMNTFRIHQKQKILPEKKIYIYIYGHPPPPHDRPRPSKHRSHRRVRAFSGVSSLSPPNVSVKNHPTTETKKPKNQSSTENAGTVLVFWFFGFLVFWFFGFSVFWFFGFLVLWFFGCLVFWLFGFLAVWFYCGEGYI